VTVLRRAAPVAALVVLAVGGPGVPARAADAGARPAAPAAKPAAPEAKPPAPATGGKSAAPGTEAKPAAPGAGGKATAPGTGAGEGTAAPAPSPPSLVRPLGEAEVDWAAGLVLARAGAAADIRLPGPEAVRAAAERQARKRATEILRRSLKDLPLGRGRKPSEKAVEAGLAHARPVRTEYQSNGGVLLTLGVAFADLAERKPARPAPVGKPAPADHDDAPALALAVDTMPFEAAPTLLFGRKELTAGAAAYRLGEPPAGTRAVPVKRDKDGRLVVPPAGSPGDLGVPRVLIFLGTAAGK
jgi:hypothetical protein